MSQNDPSENGAGAGPMVIMVILVAALLFMLFA
jgi:hypothetical protein